VNSLIDIAAFVREPGDCQKVNLKNGESKDRRVLSLYDDTNKIVEMTIWGDMAKNLEVDRNDLVLVKGARISDYGGVRSLSGSFGTKIVVNQAQMPDELMIRQLREWKIKDFSDDQLVSISGDGLSRKYTPYTIEEINNALPSITDKAFFDVTAYIGHIKTEGSSLFYAACKNFKTCARKAISDGENFFRCENCNEKFSTPVYRYTLTIKISDHTGGIWINAFDRVAVDIVEKKADDVKNLKDIDETGYTEVFREAHHKEFNFKLLVKAEEYMGQPRHRIQALRAEKLSFTRQSKELIHLLEEYSKK
jgi:replication factor A1